jgi:signal peptidase I
MAKNKSSGTKPRSSSASPDQSDKKSAELSAGGHHLPSPAAVREMIESVAIAFVLAFLFRTFEAEAFVIPTGSMAPTLMGRHKDVVCPKCGYPYQISASEEVTPDGALRNDNYKIESGTCPMCRYTQLLDKDTSYNGDRILVSKLAYEIGEPQRWDVIVFKYPGDPLEERLAHPNETTDSRINFIKRLVGLPGDTVRIEYGDVWIKSAKDKKELGDRAQFVIARKPPRKLLAMLQPVFDNDYMPAIAKDGWPARWFSDAEDAAGDWHSDDSASFAIDGSAKTEKWLRYHHLVPSSRQWQEAAVGIKPNPIAQLITDFTAYDTGKMRMHADPRHPGPNGPGIGTHWVGDLAVQCVVKTEGPGGTLALELCKGGRQFRCQFDLSTGQATLSISRLPDWRRTASTNVRGKGEHTIFFANCDEELRLWIDGDLISFDSPAIYPDLHNIKPDDADLAPVDIAAVGAAVRVSHLRVLRDIYYNADSSIDLSGHDYWYRYEALPGRETPPSQDTQYVDFPLATDQFFVLGDNSAMSKDGRLWGTDHKDYWVPRQLLIGKALFIYWPHSWDRLPYFNSIPCPYFPNFSRMRLVR